MIIGSVEVCGHPVRIHVTPAFEQPDPQALQLDMAADQGDIDAAIAALQCATDDGQAQ